MISSRCKPLGKKMIDLGLLSDEQVKGSLEEQNRLKTKGKNIYLGELLVEQGEITSQQLDVVLDVLALDKVSLREDAIRLAIRLKASFTDGANLLLFTDMAAGENTTLVASQVAHALTLIDMAPKTILIDANLHNPTVHKIFSTPLSPGLAEVVTGNESLSSAISSSCVNGLSVLSAGESDPLIESRLISRGFTKLIDEIRDSYSIIIITTSNILDKSEAVLLASKANQVIAVATAGSITKTELRDVSKLVSSINSHLEGVILCQKAGVEQE